MGRADATDDPEARRRYLDRQPDSETFAGFGDFGFYRVTLTGAHLVAGFGRIVDLAPGDILIDLAGLDALVAAEAEVVAHMNRDHNDAARLYATKLLGAPDGDWRCAGCDPEGLELQDGRTALRLSFPRLIDGPGMLRQVLRQLADRARAA
jgi:heme oxygenase (biliverdin-IX-beta and delta-forming)